MGDLPETQDPENVETPKDDGVTTQLVKQETGESNPNLPNLNKLVGEAETSPSGALCEIPMFADRRMHSPFAAQSRLNQHGLAGFFNNIDDQGKKEEIASQLQEVSEPEELAAKHQFKEWLSKRHGMTFSPDHTDPSWMVVHSKVTYGIQDLMAIYNDEKGGKARFGAITPTYPDAIKEVAEKYENRFVSIPMEETETGWKVNIPKFQEAIKDVDVLFLTNPNNPNGHVFSEEELSQIVRACKVYKVKIISDEVWSDQVTNRGKRHIPILTIAEQEKYTDGVAMIYGTGKTFNTSAFPCSVTIIPNNETRQAFSEKQRAHKPSGEAAMVAIDCMQQNGEEYVDAVNKVLKGNIEYAATVLNKIGFKTHVSDGSSLLFVRVSEGSDDAQIEQDTQQAINLFEKAGIGIQKGERYGMKGYLRVTVGCPPEVIRSHYDKLAALATEAEKN